MFHAFMRLISVSSFLFCISISMLASMTDTIHEESQFYLKKRKTVSFDDTIHEESQFFNGTAPVEKNSLTALQDAALRNDVDTLKRLLAQNESVHEVTPHKDSVLHLGAQKGYAHIVQELLKVEDIDVNIKNAKGSSPLHIAIIWNQLEIVKQLLQHQSINISVQDNYQYIPFYYINSCAMHDLIASLGYHI